MKRTVNTRRMVMLAMFCTLAYAVTLVFHIKVAFLTFDAKDTVVCLSAMLFGPTAGILVSGVVATIESISVGNTGFWGWLMDFASTATFATVASIIYCRRRTIRMAMVGLGTSVLATTATMLLLNILVTPIYMNQPLSLVLQLMPKLLFPFNLTKSLLNAALVLLLYKPLSRALKMARVLPTETQMTGAAPDGARPSRRMQWLLPIGAILLAAVCVLVLFLLLDGRFALYDGK